MGLSRDTRFAGPRHRLISQKIPVRHALETTYTEADYLICNGRVAALGGPRQTTECYSKLEKEAER